MTQAHAARDGEAAAPIIPIVGGGVAGLMAAAHLAARGLRPIVFDADPRWAGGRLRGGDAVTLEHGGREWSFPAEHGIHGIWSGYVNFKAVLERHGISPAFVPARQETWIYIKRNRVRRAPIGSWIRNSLIPAPFHYFGLLFNLRFLSLLTPRDWLALPSVMGSFLAAMSIDPLLEQKALRGMTLVDFTANWSSRLRSFFAGLARNALAAHPEEIPAAGFIAFLRFYTLFRRDAWAFSYLPGTGGECVVEPLVRLVRELGGEVRQGRRVERLERDGERWRISHVGVGEQGQAAQTIEAEQVIMALDAPAARRLLEASPPTAEQAAALSFPPGVPTAIFRLWFSARPRRITEAGVFSGDTILDNFFWMERLQPAYGAWAEATGGSAVEGHIYGPPELLAQPDATLMARVQRDLFKVFPELRGTLLHAVLQRNEASHTLFGVGEPAAHLRVETPWPGLYACGDWVAHPAPALYLERATVTAITAANAALGAAGREPWPIVPPPPPEWLAVRIERLLRRWRQWMLRRKRERGRGA